MADDEHIAWRNLFVENSLQGVLLAVEDPGRAGKTFQLLAAKLENRAFARQVAVKNPDVVIRWCVGAVGMKDNILVRWKVGSRLEVFGNCFSGHRETVAMQKAVGEQKLHHHRDAADGI